MDPITHQMNSSSSNMEINTFTITTPSSGGSGSSSMMGSPSGSSASSPTTLSRYENQKRRDWNTFGQYLRNHRPPLSLSRCSGAHVLEFLRYLDQFGKTKKLSGSRMVLERHIEWLPLPKELLQLRHAQEAGADVVGGPELVENIRTGGLKVDFDKCVATPSMMKHVKKVLSMLVM